MNALIKLMRSKAEVKILGVVLFQEGKHLREISRLADVSPYETKKELDNLVDIGLLERTKNGNSAFFHINKNCTFAQDLKNLYLKTVGIFDNLKKNLDGIDGINFAFIYGSTAYGNLSGRGDIDLMIIGNISEESLSETVFKLQKEINKEINYIIWSKKDFINKIIGNGSFIQSLINNPKIWLVGDNHEFDGIVKQTNNRKNKAR